MKRLLAAVILLVASIGWADPPPVTAVLFSTYNFTGQALNNPIDVTAVDSLYTSSNSVIAGTSVKLHPVNGIVAYNLVPADYVVVIQGIAKSWTITVPVTSNVVNAAACLKRGVSGVNTFLWTNALAGVTINLTQNISSATGALTNGDSRAVGVDSLFTTNNITVGGTISGNGEGLTNNAGLPVAFGTSGGGNATNVALRATTTIDVATNTTGDWSPSIHYKNILTTNSPTVVTQSVIAIVSPMTNSTGGVHFGSVVSETGFIGSGNGLTNLNGANITNTPGDQLNARDFGALGNGSHDDTAALQAGLFATTNSTVAATLYLPPGVYKVTDTLVMPYQPAPQNGTMALNAGPRMKGAGMSLTRLQWPNDYAGIGIRTIIDGPNENLRFEDFTASGALVQNWSAAGDSIGLMLGQYDSDGSGYYSGRNNRIQNCAFIGWGVGVCCTNQFNLSMENSVCTSNKTAVSLTGSHGCNFHNDWIVGRYNQPCSYGIAFYPPPGSNAGDNGTVANCRFSGFTIGLYNGDGLNLLCLDDYFESNGQHVVCEQSGIVRLKGGYILDTKTTWNATGIPAMMSFWANHASYCSIDGVLIDYSSAGWSGSPRKAFNVIDEGGGFYVPAFLGQGTLDGTFEPVGGSPTNVTISATTTLPDDSIGTNKLSTALMRLIGTGGSNAVAGNLGITVLTNAGNLFVVSMSSNSYYTLTNLDARAVVITDTNVYGGGVFSWLAGDGSGLTNLTGVGGAGVTNDQVLTGSPSAPGVFSASNVVASAISLTNASDGSIIFTDAAGTTTNGGFWDGKYHGDGSLLTGIAGGTNAVAGVTNEQPFVSFSETLAIRGGAPTLSLSNQFGEANLSLASGPKILSSVTIDGTFTGDGSGLTGIQAGLTNGSAAILSSLSVTGAVGTLSLSSANGATNLAGFNGTNFYGNGSGLTNLAGVGGLTNGSTATFSGITTFTGAPPILALIKSATEEVDIQVGYNTNLIVNTPINATAFIGDGSGLTGLSASAITTGVLPMGTVSTGLSEIPGPFLTSNGVARSYSYNGSGLTNLNASQLTTGTVPLAQLPSGVVTNNGVNGFTFGASATNRLSDSGSAVNGVGITNKVLDIPTGGAISFNGTSVFSPVTGNLSFGTSLQPNVAHSKNIGTASLPFLSATIDTVTTTNLVAALITGNGSGVTNLFGGTNAPNPSAITLTGGSYPGTYYWHGPTFCYTNGGNSLFKDFYLDAGDGEPRWGLTNSTYPGIGGLYAYYITDSGRLWPTGSWTVYSAPAPAPVGTFVSSQPPELPLRWNGSQVRYVAAAGGNDLTAGYGPSQPYSSLGMAVSNAVAGDVVKLSAGTFYEDYFILSIPSGISIIGEGRGATRVIHDTQQDQLPRWLVYSNTYIARLASGAVVQFEGSTNTVEDLLLFDASEHTNKNDSFACRDGVVADNILVKNCEVFSGDDTVDWRGPGTITVMGCVFHNTCPSGGLVAARCLCTETSAAAKIIASNCILYGGQHDEGGANKGEPRGCVVYAKTGSMDLTGLVIYPGGSSPTTLTNVTMCVASGATITMRGAFEDSTNIVGAGTLSIKGAH